ncbi:ATP-binding protein [Xanthobacter agilis]|uniref:ATP-binding protein n=1 Tax=Xanthobacter agilis TaxID=47492 RepID=UPI00372C3C2B
MSDPFAPLAGPGARETAGRPAGAVCLRPVPADAPPAPERHPTLGEAAGRWVYRDAAGELVGFALRFDQPDGGKEFRPLSCWRMPDGRMAWRWTAWPAPRPLYGHDRLAAAPAAPVLVAEGEKAADAAGRLLPAVVVITSPNGSKSAAKADWAPLAGRRVIVWPDADEAGAAYGTAVVALADGAGAASTAILSPPAGAAVGWDAADAEAEGWDAARAADFIASAAVPVARPDGARAGKPPVAAGKKSSGRTDSDPATARRRRPAQRDSLMGLCEGVGLWHDEEGEGFATIPVAQHVENWRLDSKFFRRWLAVRAYEADGLAPGGQALEDAVRVLGARAYSEGTERAPCLRVGASEGRSYIDLCDSAWRAVEIDAEGWRIVSAPPVAFIRSGQMRPLPAPEAGYLVEELRGFVNVERDDDFVLLLAWLVAALRSRGPYPILTFAGEQGTGKSTLSRLVRELVDPNAAPIRAAPRDDRDLIVAAVNSHVIALDNLSAVPAWLADGLCRLATGGGFASRTLHTDRDESVLQAVRPIILNGIPSLTDRADLASRAVTVRLKPIAETARRGEAEMLANWQTAAPRILGALFDAISCGMRRFDSIQLDRLPRMADFARFASACEPAFGCEDGTFLSAYNANQSDTIETTFEADPVAVAVRDLIRNDCPSGWHGSATDLLSALNMKASESVKRLKLWPATAASLGNRIDRIAPVLRAQGFIVERRHSGVRTISIVPLASEAM